MNYFLDLEFLEGPQRHRKTFLEALFAVKKFTEPTIDLISIGIVCEDGREYYAISKDFNLREAWNRYDRAEQTMFEKQNDFKGRKVYWIRENVLKPIWEELIKKEMNEDILAYNEYPFSYSSMKYLINKYGKSNKQIAEDIKDFIYYTHSSKLNDPLNIINSASITFDCELLKSINNLPKFYGYYSDYDWVCFCWLFGKMIDLPKGFPMYCIDLKQTMDEKSKYSLAKPITNDPSYPKQTNEHNALSDARWNFELYKFLLNV